MLELREILTVGPRLDVYSTVKLSRNSDLRFERNEFLRNYFVTLTSKFIYLKP
ncbi:hypothetical protein ACS0TY_016913 [Phlomoides rotata]